MDPYYAAQSYYGQYFHQQMVQSGVAKQGCCAGCQNKTCSQQPKSKPGSVSKFSANEQKQSPEQFAVQNEPDCLRSERHTMVVDRQRMVILTPQDFNLTPASYKKSEQQYPQFYEQHE